MTIKPLPNSAKTLLVVFETVHDTSVESLSKITGLSKRTLRYAIKRLDENHMIIKKLDMRDTRKILYSARKSEEIQRCTP